MELSLYLKALLLGIIEGATEFIPVSSTGHLLISSELLDFHAIPSKAFEIIIQLGAIMAVCVLYRKKIMHVIKTIPNNKTSQKFTYNILVAFLPAVFVGAIFHDSIKSLLFSPNIIAISLIVGGIIMIIAEKIKPKKKYDNIDHLPVHIALKIGVFQLIAMIPGTSRSGATIIGAMLIGVSRKTAAEFSFFLAIPTIFAATIYDIVKNHALLNFDHALLILTGFTAAFISAIFIVSKFIEFVGKYGFSAFGYYRIIIGALILYAFY